MAVAEQTPISQPAMTSARSHEEVQKLLRAEIDSLKALLEQRFLEIAKLTEQLERLSAPDPDPKPTSGSVEAGAEVAAAPEPELAGQLRRALRANLEHGPIHGVPSYPQQIEILRQSPLFDGEWYLRIHTDVQSSGMDPGDHYVRSGAFEGRNPGPEFDTMAYYRANPDVAKAGWPALVHFAGFGQAEGRAAS